MTAMVQSLLSKPRERSVDVGESWALSHCHGVSRCHGVPHCHGAPHQCEVAHSGDLGHKEFSFIYVSLLEVSQLKHRTKWS